MISKLGLGRLSVSVFGRNLFYFYKALKNYDAESSDRNILGQPGYRGKFYHSLPRKFPVVYTSCKF